MDYLSYYLLFLIILKSGYSLNETTIDTVINTIENEYITSLNKSEQVTPFITRCCGYKIKGRYINCSSDEITDLKIEVYNDTTIVDIPGDYFSVETDKKCARLFPFMVDEKWYVQLDGSLHVSWAETFDTFKPDNYCLLIEQDSKNNDSSYIVKNALFCETKEVSAAIENNRKPSYNKYGMIISMPFLMVTFFVYACVPELQNIHGKCLMCYVSTLLVAYIFLVSVQLNNKTEDAFCVVAPFIIYFAFLVSFMWLNVMCIDIWWTFSGRKGFRDSGSNSERTRFTVYSIYAWGIPLLMLCIAIGLQFAENLPSYVVSPSFGVEKCWFPDDKAMGYYFYGPILLIILANLTLFAYTSIQIYKVQRDVDQSMRHESQRHGSDKEMKQRYKLYLKLMLVFGVNWLMEIVSWLVSGPQWLWYVTDMCNALYGVFIFFIFVCKANVWKLCRKRYHVFMGRPYLANTYAPTSSTRSTGVSQTTAHAPGNGTEADSYGLTTSTAA